MIVEAIAFFNANQLIVAFTSHFVIFIGALYVALQNRSLPQWHITPLWYVGLFSFLTCFTIICQWSIGPEFPLSYWNLGQMAHSAVDVTLAILAAIMLIGTVRKDIKARKKRVHQ